MAEAPPPRVQCFNIYATEPASQEINDISDIVSLKRQFLASLEVRSVADAPSLTRRRLNCVKCFHRHKACRRSAMIIAGVV